MRCVPQYLPLSLVRVHPHTCISFALLLVFAVFFLDAPQGAFAIFPWDDSKKSANLPDTADAIKSKITSVWDSIKTMVTNEKPNDPKEMSVYSIRYSKNKKEDELTMESINPYASPGPVTDTLTGISNPSFIDDPLPTNPYNHTPPPTKKASPVTNTPKKGPSNLSSSNNNKRSHQSIVSAPEVAKSKSSEPSPHNQGSQVKKQGKKPNAPTGKIHPLSANTGSTTEAEVKEHIAITIPDPEENDPTPLSSISFIPSAEDGSVPRNPYAQSTTSHASDVARSAASPLLNEPARMSSSLPCDEPRSLQPLVDVSSRPMDAPRATTGSSISNEPRSLTSQVDVTTEAPCNVDPFAGTRTSALDEPRTLVSASDMGARVLDPISRGTETESGVSSVKEPPSSSHTSSASTRPVEHPASTTPSTLPGEGDSVVPPSRQRPVTEVGAARNAAHGSSSSTTHARSKMPMKTLLLVVLVPVAVLLVLIPILVLLSVRARRRSVQTRNVSSNALGSEFLRLDRVEDEPLSHTDASSSFGTYSSHDVYLYEHTGLEYGDGCDVRKSIGTTIGDFSTPKVPLRVGSLLDVELHQMPVSENPCCETSRECELF